MAAMSGVKVFDDVETKFKDMKLKHNARYMLLKLTDDLKNIEVEKVAPLEKTYDDLLQDLPPMDCRYAIFDYGVKGKETSKTDKLILITWCPDEAPMRKKMIYASSTAAVRSACKGIAKDIQGNDMGDISEEVIKNKLK